MQFWDIDTNMSQPWGQLTQFLPKMCPNSYFSLIAACELCIYLYQWLYVDSNSTATLFLDIGTNIKQSSGQKPHVLYPKWVQILFFRK